MKYPPSRTGAYRRWIAALAILALLCNAAFAIACDFHDLGHPAMAHGGVLDVSSGHDHDHDHHRGHDPDDDGGRGDDAVHPHGQSDADGSLRAAGDAQPGMATTGSDAIDWHAVFHVGHGIAQALGLASVPEPAVLPSAGNVGFPELITAAPRSRPGTILRPPIRA